jgi:hypothetical protein
MEGWGAKMKGERQRFQWLAADGMGDARVRAR